MLLLEIFLKAPPELIPSPFNVNASSPIVIPPDNSNAAPCATVVPDAVVPRALLWDALNAPADIVVVAVYELLPDNVKVPDPVLVSAPPVPVIDPETVVEVLSPPAVKVFELNDTVPAPAIDPMVSLAERA